MKYQDFDTKGYKEITEGQHRIRMAARQATEYCINTAREDMENPPAWAWEYKLAELILKDAVNVLNQSLYHGEAADYLRSYYDLD